jgi:hypothetical protein
MMAKWRKLKAALLAVGALAVIPQLGSCFTDLLQDVLIGVMFD